jgi:thioredoxin reductase (NADPH)
MTYDVIIVGAGPAGMSAAIYTSRRALKTLVVSKDIGGQAAATDTIENYPGFELIGGFELMQKFMTQAQKFGAEFASGEVIKIEKQGDEYLVATAVSEYRAKCLILAFGLTPRDLNVPGEKELMYKGITSCATCDGPLFKGKDVIIVGGGNSALDAAEYMSKLAKKIYCIIRGDKFKGEQILIDKVSSAENIEILYGTKVKEIKGKDRVESVIITSALAEDPATDKELVVQGVIVEIGFVAKTQWVGNIVKLNERNEIITDRDSNTSDPGVFSCGDVTDISYKQAVISAGEGAKAGLQAAKYLASKSGKNVLLGTDWGKRPG